MFELEEFLPYRLSVLTNTISQGIAETYRQRYELSVTEWRIIAVLGRFPGIPAREVAERTAMDKVAVSRAVKRLEQKGYLYRTTDPGDRRCQRLCLSETPGMDVLNEVIPRAREYESRLLESLSGSQLEELNRIMEVLYQRALSLNHKKSRE